MPQEQQQITIMDTTDMDRMKLRVWWIPQIPGKPFLMPVSSLAEGARLIHTLAQYDLFQFENNIKPDYSNAGGLQAYYPEEEEWMDWDDPETGEDINDWMECNPEMWMTEEELSHQ